MNFYGIIFHRNSYYEKEPTLLKWISLISGPSGVKFLTRKDIYEILESSNELTFEKKLEYMEELRD